MYGKPEVMYLNMYNDHVSYITNFSSYATKSQCPLCEILFRKKCNYNRHTAACYKKSKTSFPGGYNKLPRAVYDLLEEFNIHVANDLKHYPWYSVFDMEATLALLLKIQNGTEITRSKPSSPSICKFKTRIG